MFMQLVKIQTQVVCALVCRAEFVSFQGGKCNLRKKAVLWNLVRECGGDKDGKTESKQHCENDCVTHTATNVKNKGVASVHVKCTEMILLQSLSLDVCTSVFLC